MKRVSFTEVYREVRSHIREMDPYLALRYATCHSVIALRTHKFLRRRRIVGKRMHICERVKVVLNRTDGGSHGRDGDPIARASLQYASHSIIYIPCKLASGFDKGT